MKDVFGGGFLSPSSPQIPQVLATQQAQGALADAGRAFAARAAQGDYSWLADATPEQLEAYRKEATAERTKQLRRGTLTGEEAPPPVPSLAELQREQTTAQRDNRYGTDLSWLDPSMQYQANLLGTSAGSTAAADPNAIAQQNAAMARAGELSNANLQFESPAQQQALMQQWAQIQGGQGAPQFMGNAQQQQLAQQLLGVAAPQFSGDADQRAVLNQALGMATNQGPGSLAFDTSGRQGEQYGNLQGIIAGGGATAIEMADRARQRGDSEAWLRGQREADMADYAERGLTGSGMELLSLSSDRQAAAGRNSLADLETAKALEERRLGAINSAAGLATNMRGQTIDEQGLLNTRATSGLSAASSTANSMRDANIREQLGLNEAARGQISGAADITGQMRTQDYNERTFLDDRMTNALQQQLDAANKMRDQTATERIANSNAQQAALSTQATTSSNARNSSAQEAQYRATSADDFSELNQSAINRAAQDNQRVLTDAYSQMMNNRQQWEMNNFNQQNNIGINRDAGDQADNDSGYRQGQALGASDTAFWNNMSAEQRAQIMAIFGGGQDRVADAAAAGNAAAGQIAAGGVGAAGTAIGAVIGGVGAGATVGGATAAQGAATGAQVGSQALLSKDEEERLRRGTATGSGT